MKRLLIAVFLISALFSVQAYSALPAPDAQGDIETVMVLSQVNDVHRFRIYVTNYHSSKGCFREDDRVNNGIYIEVTTASSFIDIAQYNHMYSMALAAQAQEKRVALDGCSSTSTPHTIWMIN